MDSPVLRYIVERDHAMRAYSALVAEARARGTGLRLRVTGSAGIGKTTFLKGLATGVRGKTFWISGSHSGVAPADFAQITKGRKRITIFVDDLQFVDETTLAGLRAVIELGLERIDIICTDRRDEAPELGRHATIRLTPLRNREAQTLVRSEFSAADAATVADIVRASAGLPFAIAFLAAEARRASEHDARVTTFSVDDMLSLRLAHCSETAREIVRICSVVDDSVPLRVLTSVIGVTAPNILEAAADVADLVTLDQMRFDLRHSLLREAARRSLLHPIPAMRRVLDAYGPDEDDPRDLRSIVTCAIACGETLTVVDTALRAARIAVRAGALQTGTRLLEIALRYAERPIPAELAAEYADVLQRAVHHVEAAEFLRDLLQAAIDARDATRAIALLAPFASAALGLERFVELDTLAARIASIANRESARIRIRTILCSTAAFSGRLDAYDAFTPSSSQAWQDDRAAAFAAALRGDAQSAQRHLERYQAHLTPRHARLAVADRAMSAAIGLFLDGNGALETAHETWADDGDRGGYPTGTAFRILHYFNAGRWDESQAIVEALPFWEFPAEEPLPIIDARLMFSAVTGRRLRHPDGTLVTIRAMIRRGQRRHAMGVATWYCVPGIGNAEPPPDVVGFARQMLGETQIPYMVASFPLAAALAAPVLGDAAVRAALMRKSPFQSRWHSAHLELAAGVLDSDHGALRRARDAFDSLACPALAMIAGVRLPLPRARDIAMARAVRLGPPSSEPPSDTLTPRERDVSELAALGASNREIAQRLHIAERTVEVHLTAIYRKLRVRSRGALAARLLRWRPASSAKPAGV